MFSTLFTIALFAAPAIQGSLAFTITTPTFTQVGNPPSVPYWRGRPDLRTYPYSVKMLKSLGTRPQALITSSLSPLPTHVVTLCERLPLSKDYPINIQCSADLGDHNGTSVTYKVAIPSGTQVQLSLEDAAGDEAWSGTVNSLSFALLLKCVTHSILLP